jgi:hypothetical protein
MSFCSVIASASQFIVRYNKQLSTNSLTFDEVFLVISLRSWRNSRPISAEIALPQLQSEIKVALFLFASRSFLANNLHFMIKLIDKAIVINVKIIMRE